MKATELLKNDHYTVKKLFTQFGRTTLRAPDTREHFVDKIAIELKVHAKVEEEIFYPAMREIGDAKDIVQEAEDEHATVKKLLAEIQGMGTSDDRLSQKMTELQNAVLHHATEVENEMFPRAQKLGADELVRLGQKIHERKQALTKSLLQRTKRAAKRMIRKIA